MLPSRTVCVYLNTTADLVQMENLDVLTCNPLGSQASRNAERGDSDQKTEAQEP